MKSSIGYLKKILLTFSLFCSIFIPHSEEIFAQESPFRVTSSFIHRVDGISVNTELTLTLATDTTKVLSLYTTSIQAQNIKAECYTSSGSLIKCESYNRVSTTDVQLDLRNTVVTLENPLEIKIVYTYPLHNEISYSFPSKVLDAKTEEVKIIYPKEKGDFSWSSENISSKEQKGENREIGFKNPTKDTISIFFDKYLSYSFTINRQFNNGNQEGTELFELILPLDDSTQLTLWDTIDPIPTSAIQGDDGNYILRYQVKAGESLTVKLSGYILKENNKQENPTLQPYLSNPAGLWEIRDSAELKRVSTFMNQKGLKIDSSLSNVDTLNSSERELFYKFLYQYTIYRLDIHKDPTLGVENSARLGVSDILERSHSASQVDFADFYMALLRNYSIPSRMVIGYISNVTGYTSDGFYHYWIEYFDANKNEWIQADPFLEEYLGYSIFGTQLNDHITILKRGKSPMAPTLTFYTPTDFIIQLEEKNVPQKDMSVSSSLSLDDYDITKKYTKGYITTSNTGNIVISKIELKQSNIGNIKKYLDSVNNNSSLILMPKQTSNIQLNIPTERLNLSKVSISAQYINNAGEKKDLTVSDELTNNEPLYTKILSKILSLISFALFILIPYVIYKLIRKKKWTQG